MPLYLFCAVEETVEHTLLGREYAIIVSLLESSRGNKAEGNQAIAIGSLLVQLGNYYPLPT